MSRFGRYQAPEPPSALMSLHFHRPRAAAPLREVDHEPRCAVLDQQDLLRQGIRTSQLIPGAPDVDALGSCTANATVAHLSGVLSLDAFGKFVYGQDKQPTDPFADAVAAEKAAIQFYHACTDQTGDPAQEWPPTDCGSSGPYIASEAMRLGLASGQQIASGPDNLASLLQTSSVLVGSPYLSAWMEPDAHGFVDGDGSVETVQRQIAQGVAGGHETVITAIEKLTLLPSGLVDPFGTVIRLRNSWGRAWGDHGSYRLHLSTLAVVLGPQCDFRALVA